MFKEHQADPKDCPEGPGISRGVGAQQVEQGESGEGRKVSSRRCDSEAVESFRGIPIDLAHVRCWMGIMKDSKQRLECIKALFAVRNSRDIKGSLREEEPKPRLVNAAH